MKGQAYEPRLSDSWAFSPKNGITLLGYDSQPFKSSSFIVLWHSIWSWTSSGYIVRVVASYDSWIQIKDCTAPSVKPVIVFRQLCLFCDTQLSSQWKKNPGTDGFHCLYWKTLTIAKVTFFPCYVEPPWIPGSGHNWLDVSINIRIKTYLSIPRTEFGLFYLNWVRNIFCLFFSVVNIVHFLFYGIPWSTPFLLRNNIYPCFSHSFSHQHSQQVTV